MYGERPDPIAREPPRSVAGEWHEALLVATTLTSGETFARAGVVGVAYVGVK